MSATLAGTVVDPSGNAVIQWQLYSGPAPVSFADPNSANTMVFFGQSGSFTFLLSANDAVHAVASTPTATPTPTPTATPSATPTISVLVSRSQVVEGSDATFTISSSSVLSQPLKVRYSMSGKAQQGIDYTLAGTPGQVTILAGQSSATVVLHAVPDHVAERNETAIMTLTNGTGYKLSTHPKATVTIVNGL